MRLRDFDAIIFDNDGVLVDSEIIHLDVERKLLAQMGLEYDLKDYLTRFVGLSNRDFYAELRADHARIVGGELPSDFGETLQEKIWERVKAELLPISGVPSLIEAFGGKVAVGSSAPYERLIKKLKIAGLFHLLAPHIYSADHVENGKPAPDLFLHAARQIEVSPETCVVIEDSVNGVRAAKAAGMTTIGFTGGGHCDPGLHQRLKASGADAVVSNHAMLKSMI
ncbi:HAD family phosphatase [Erythrobacter sp. KY5]|uniref:HAD family hydrolase n=1 Tax=Erythrobacter sp. KY5 TaxID=2011159 RepID=UPI001F242895|nr:HAD family hydrolase [Erythrobacter sp. KY5]